MIGQIVINSIISGSIYTLMALGFTLVYGTLNFFNMAHGVSYLLGAYLAYTFNVLLNIPIPLAFLLSVAVAGMLMTMINLLAFRPLMIRNAPSWALVASSIGIQMFMYALVAAIFGSRVLSVRKNIDVRVYSLGENATITSTQIIIFVAMLAVVLLLLLVLKKTRLGIAMRATSNEETMATIVGINTDKICIGTFAVGSGIAAFAGCLICLETDLTPIMGGVALLKAIVASIIGGIGNIGGCLAGGMLLGSVENFGIMFFNAGWKDAIALGLLLFFMLLRSVLKRVEAEKRED